MAPKKRKFVLNLAASGSLFFWCYKEYWIAIVLSSMFYKILWLKVLILSPFFLKAVLAILIFFMKPKRSFYLVSIVVIFSMFVPVVLASLSEVGVFWWIKKMLFIGMPILVTGFNWYLEKN